MRIDVESLVKTYGRREVVRSVSFVCAPGTVTGFLGPNGAGKSTVMKMMVGLATPDSGRATFDGVCYADLVNPGLKVGVMLDASVLHPGRTGRETLLMAAMQLGQNADAVSETLVSTGTADAAKTRIKAYSLGMRQRLGLGLAMLGEPKVLILDEPFNGLDPYGVKWMSDTVREFARKGGTVLLSSHMLKEVEETADVAVVLQAGAVTANHDLRQHGLRTECEATDVNALRLALNLAGISFYETETGVIAEAQTERVSEACLMRGVVLKSLKPAKGRLEEIFMNATVDRKLVNASVEVK